MSDKPRTHRPRRVMVFGQRDIGLWEVVDQHGTKPPKNATEAQRLVEKGGYGEGTFLVLSTVEDPTKVEKVSEPVYRYKASKVGES